MAPIRDAFHKLLIRLADREANDEGNNIWTRPKLYPPRGTRFRSQDINWNWTLLQWAFGFEINYDPVDYMHQGPTFSIIVSLGFVHFSYQSMWVTV